MIFTAAGAHMAVNMCDDTNLAVSAYESFVSFNPLHIQLFLNTGKEKWHHGSFIMEEDSIYDIREDMLEKLEEILDQYDSFNQRRRTQIASAVQTLRAHSGWFNRHISDILDERKEKLSLEYSVEAEVGSKRKFDGDNHDVKANAKMVRVSGNRSCDAEV